MSYILVMIIFPNEKWSEQKGRESQQNWGLFLVECEVSDFWSVIKIYPFFGLIKLDAKMYGNQAANVW